MKQAIATLGLLGSVTAGQSASTRHSLVSVYGSNSVTLWEMDALIRGGETIIAGSATNEVQLYYQSLTATSPGVYDEKLYSFDNYVIDKIDNTLDSYFPSAVALVRISPSSSFFFLSPLSFFVFLSSSSDIF